MGYRTIVVGTDGSVTASIAQQTAARLARRCRADLVLVCGFGPPKITRPMAEGFAARAADAVRREGVEPRVELGTGEPAELILEVAERHNADLIVVGNKGMGQATRFRLGSVPDRVAHFAPCDLLIVHTSDARPLEGPGTPYRNILAATDGSPTASEAARKALELALLVRAEVTLVFVGDPIVGAIKLEGTAASGPDGVTVRTRVVEGDPAEQICEAAERESADLIVVGNKGMSGPRRFLGSVPNKVAHYSPTDVLIVKTVDRSASDLEPGQGGVVDVDGRTLAVYRDEAGETFTLSPRCTHMGCTVDWNGAERTWDCPCHGSRYDYAGRVIRGPAVRPLEPVGGDGQVPPAEATATSEAPAEALAEIPASVPSRSAERFVIVGASLTGGTAAATLRENGFAGPLVLIGAEPNFPYERPPLSKTFLRGETRYEEALVRPEAFYRDNDIETRLGSTVTRIDPAARTVSVAGGDDVAYDRLLIATGARNRRFPIPGRTLDGVYDLRTFPDAARLRAEIAPGRRAVLGGMGFIGSEVAASLRQRGVEVSVVDGGSVPLERVLGPDVGRAIEAMHRDQGVRMTFGDRLAAFEGEGRVERVVTANGLRLECDFAVVGLGVEPVVDLVAGSGIDVDNGILVDEYSRTNVDGIYAAGDVANHYHPVFGRRLRIEHWQNAARQGRAAALSMLGTGAPYDEIHWFWSDQYDHNLQYAGFHTEWDDLVVRGSLEALNFIAFYMKGGRVQASVSLNRGSDLRASMGLIRAAAAVETGRLRDEAVDLRALEPAAAAAGR
ncbi:hypothetical protein BH20ACT24_BH20ACT24_03120 [soil metagenome]